MKIRDQVIRGAVSGIIAGTPDTVLNALEYNAGLTDLTYGQMGASLFKPKDKAKKSNSQIVGYTANYIMLGISGIAFNYLLSRTGREYSLAKGLGFGLVSWISIYGLGQKFGLTPWAKKPGAPLLSLVDHLIYGGLLGLITPILTNNKRRS